MSPLTCENIVRDHLQQLGRRFSCSSEDDRLWVVSPYALPDGDLIEIAVIQTPSGQIRVTDLGETLRHLANIGFDPRTTSKGEYLLAEILKQHHVEVDRGMITKGTSQEEIGAAIHDVLMACYGVAHLVFLSRGYRPATFAEEVAHLLTEQGYSFEPRHHVVGRITGTKYDVDFLVHGKQKDGLMMTLSPTAPSGATAMVNATYRKWSDLRNGHWLGTVLDDRLVSWRPNDVLFFDSVSDVCRWTERETLEAALRHKVGLR